MPHWWPWQIEVFQSPPGPVIITFRNLLLITGTGFLLIAFMIYKFGVPFFRAILAERRQSIIDASEQVQATLDETNKMVDDYKHRLETIEDETARRMEEAVREAETLRDQILADARNDVDILIRRGHDEVERERSKALLDLRQQFVEDTIQAAGYAATKSLDADSQRRLVADFVAKLGSRS